MALTIEYTRLTPLFPNGSFIQWKLYGATASGTYAFTVSRSESPNGPWDLVAKDLVNQYSFVDRLDQPAGTNHRDTRRPNQLAVFRTFYYRTVVRAPDGAEAETIDTTDPQLDRKQAQYWRKMVRDLSLGLNKLNGVPCAVLKRRHWGERCKVCYDKQTRESLRANCPKCYATGFTGGYWAPVLVHLRRSAPQGATQQQPEGKSEASSVRVWLPYLPVVDRDDIIVFLRDNHRYKVDDQSETQLTTVTVHQVATAVELPRSDIAYTIKVDDAVKPIL